MSQITKDLGGSVAVLPHDSGITDEDRILWGKPSSQSADSDDGNVGNELFSATLAWIAKSFPGQKEDAERARRRMEAVHRIWQELAQTSERVRGRTHSRAAWPVEQLRERMRFGKDPGFRQADIVVFDAPPEDSNAKPLMIIEYVDEEDRDAVARWWLEATRVQVVALFSGDSDRRLYSSRGAWDLRGRHSDRWDLPLPYDFKALSDPTDVSIETLLDAVRRGHPEYLDRIVAEWVRCSAAGLHGGAPWKPQLAKKIIDGLARVDDVELARRVLWETSADSRDRGIWLGHGEDWLDEQVLAELFAPLLWRLPRHRLN